MQATFTLLCCLSLAAGADAAGAAAPAAAGAAGAAAAPAAATYHVVECFNSETITADALTAVLTGKLGATKEQAEKLVEKIDQKGQAVVVAGSKDACEEAAKHFDGIGMKTEVRPLKATDVPSEYDDSDVVVAGPQQLNELLEDGSGGVLVTFYAPWCGHCKTMVPAFKEAATALKAEGVRVAAVDCQMSPTMCQQLGVKGYPAIKWLQKKEDAVVVAEYQGGRDANSFVRFAQAAAKATALKSKLGAGTAAPAPAEEGAAPAAAAPAAAAATEAPKSKLGQSKLGGAAAGGVGVQKAKMPAEAEAEPKPAAAAA